MQPQAHTITPSRNSFSLSKALGKKKKASKLHGASDTAGNDPSHFPWNL